MEYSRWKKSDQQLSLGKKKMKECTGQAHKKGAPSKRKGSNYVTEWL